MAASSEAWQTSAPGISLSPSLDGSDRSSSPPPVGSNNAAKVDHNQSPTTPTSPSTYYDARSRPMSMAVDDPNSGAKQGEKSDKKSAWRQGKRKVFSLSPSKSSSSKSSGASPATPGLTTDQKLSIKKMRAFLFTRTVPRPEVRGLFPSSMRVSLSRSRSSGPSQAEPKGKGKEKDSGKTNGGVGLSVSNSEKETVCNPPKVKKCEIPNEFAGADHSY